MKRMIAVLCLGLVAAAPMPAQAAGQLDSRRAGFTVPLHIPSADQGTFDGTLTITRFARIDGQLAAVGLVTGTLVDENGTITGIVRSVTLPVDRGTTADASAVSAAAVCDILHLTLGPLDLDLLGLVVHLDRVVLDLTAVSAAGNLLGNLLCAITNLLNGPGAVSQLVALLNQVLDILT